MDGNIIKAIEEAVVAFVKSKRMFTALDISNTIKDQGHFVRHRKVAPVVRDIFESGALQHFNYERQLIDLTLENGDTAQAFLYLEEGADPHLYDAQRNQRALDIHQQADDNDKDMSAINSTAPRPPSATPSKSMTASILPGGVDSVQRWADGRLALPVDFGKHLIDKGQPIFVHPNNHQLELFAGVRPNITVQPCIKSDKRILISNEILNRYFGDLQNFEVSFSSTADSIFITRA